MLSKTILTSGLALAISIPGVGALAGEIAMVPESQDQNQTAVATQDQVTTRNQGEDIQLRVQERNQIHQADPDAVGPADQERDRLRLQTHDPEGCQNPDCSDCPMNMERTMNTERKAEGPGAGPQSPQGDPEPGEHGAGAQDGTGPINETASDGTGNRYGTK